MKYICHTEAYPVITEDGCDLNIDYMNINTNPSSSNFLTVDAKIDGTFCNFGYENQWGKIINGVETPYASFGPGHFQDTILTGTNLGVLPGDNIQLFLDNANEHPNNTPSSTCRVYNKEIKLECDLAIDSFSVFKNSCGYTTIEGKLKTKYLKLLNNYKT